MSEPSNQALSLDSAETLPPAPLHIRAALGLLRGLSRLPFSVLAFIGAVLGTLLWLVPGSRRHVASTNLKLCFPQMGTLQRERLLRRNFVALMQMLLEYGYNWYAPREKLMKLVRVEGAEHLKRSDGRPVILSMPHFTGLDLAGLRVSLEHPMVSVYSRQKDPHLDLAFRQGRLRLDSGIIFPRQAGIRPVIKAMKQGYGLYYLPDQDHGVRDAVFVDFFGVPAATITGLSRLAAITNAVVLPCRPRRERDGYTVVIDPPLENFPGPSPEHDAQRMNHIIEQQVLQQPEQYFWVHRRFKSRPEGSPSLY